MIFFMPRARKKKRILIKLLGIFLLLRISDALVFYYSYIPVHPVPGFRIIVAASLVWTTPFLVEIWRRQNWARYMAIIPISLVALVYTLYISMALLGSQENLMGRTVSLGLSIVTYGATAAYLACSRSILKWSDPGW